MKMKAILVLIIILTSTLGFPVSNGVMIEMQESGEMALLGLFFLLAFTGTNSTPIYESEELTISYTHLAVEDVDPMFVIETTYHNVSARLDFYVVANGTITKFAVLGVNVTPMLIWVEFLSPDKTWNYYEFQLSGESTQ